MIFTHATRRLTLTYTLIQLLLLGAFALGIYTFVSRTFDFDAIASDGEPAINAAERGFDTLRTGLLWCYGALMLIAPLTGYLMARATLRPVKISYEAQQRFVDDASHEFRTPLAILQGEIELALSRQRTPAEYERVLGGSLDVVEGLTSLTDALLLLARGTATDLADTFEDVDLAEIARTCAAQRTPDGPAPTITVDASVGVGVGAVIVGSPELISRALLNVLDNALKFTPPDETITVSVRADSSRATIQVTDTGTGMSANAISHAFDRFWRGDNARTQGGHGLGLALVQQICLAHQGKATVASREGRGTTLTLTFPLASSRSRHTASTDPAQ
ncbi:sensor histidine kinase [Pengzhenrongella phosphoraccumulans]|uniref:sensor histidine kinase n=1 Tax=Pengzhenrongella phosphoraccumulans TaxID=3114394 RepID=UPI00388F3C3E